MRIIDLCTTDDEINIAFRRESEVIVKDGLSDPPSD